VIIQNLDRAYRLMKRAPIRGDFVEFGVFRGGSLIQTMKMLKFKDAKYYGFDSFEGLPPTKVPLKGNLKQEFFEKNFSNTSLEYVKEKLRSKGLNAVLVKGYFNKLKPLSSYGIKKIRFAYIDADIYEGYRDALSLITPYLQVGTVMLFDEFIAPSDYRYQGIREHGTRAIREWERKTGLNLHIIRFKWSTALCVIVDENYLKKHGAFIESLRSDNIVQSLTDATYQFLHKIRVF